MDDVTAQVCAKKRRESPAAAAAAPNAPHQQDLAPTFVITTTEGQDAASVHWVSVVCQISARPEAQGPLAVAGQAAENLTATDFALTLNPGGSYWQHQGLLQTPFPYHHTSPWAHASGL